MKTVFTRDEIVAGVNDACAPSYRTILASGQQHSGAAVAAKFQAAVRTARINAKLERAAELAERLAARRTPPVQAPSPAELAEQWRRDYAAREARVCAEAKAAYDARNPHRKAVQG